MFIVDFILDNYVMIYELIGLLVMLRISAHISKRRKRITVVIVLLLLLEIIVARVEQWTATFDSLSLARPFLSACDYSIFPFILIFLMLLLEDEKPKLKILLFMSLPAAVCSLLYFTSQWTHIVFYFTEDNMYKRGPLAYLPYAMFGAYCVVFIVRNILYFKDYSRVSRIAPVYVTVGSMLGAVCFLLIRNDTHYGPLFMSAILLYYICFYIHMSKVDTLTQLLNRQSYYHDLEQFSSSVTAVVSVDMNGLKYLNDNFGHEAGDAALVEVSRIMTQYSGKNGMPYRVGGDEFIILYVGGPEDEPVNAIENMRNNMAKTPYVCAYGYAKRVPGSQIEDAVREADARMYEDKAALKKAALESGGEYRGRD